MARCQKKIWLNIERLSLLFKLWYCVVIAFHMQNTYQREHVTIVFQLL